MVYDIAREIQIHTDNAEDILKAEGWNISTPILYLLHAISFYSHRPVWACFLPIDQYISRLRRQMFFTRFGKYEFLADDSFLNKIIGNAPMGRQFKISHRNWKMLIAVVVRRVYCLTRYPRHSFCRIRFLTFL